MRESCEGPARNSVEPFQSMTGKSAKVVHNPCNARNIRSNSIGEILIMVPRDLYKTCESSATVQWSCWFAGSARSAEVASIDGLPELRWAWSSTLDAWRRWRRTAGRLAAVLLGWPDMLSLPACWACWAFKAALKNDRNNDV